MIKGILFLFGFVVFLIIAFVGLGVLTAGLINFLLWPVFDHGNVGPVNIVQGVALYLTFVVMRLITAWAG